MSAQPGWYPDTTSAGTQRYWDGETWTEHRAPLAPKASNGNLVWKIALGILVAAFAIWVIYGIAHANDDVDCASKNLDRAINGQPALDCG